MKLEQIKKLCAQWEDTGRIAFIYPRKKKVSLNGFPPISFKEAGKKIREFLKTEIEKGKK